MRQSIIAGNWKMQGNKASIASLLSQITAGYQAKADVSCVVFPPYVYLETVADHLASTGIRFGAQNLSVYDAGAYTGEISAAMLVDVGCNYVLVGHSERRSLYHEDNKTVALKFAQAKRHQLCPILCVGETLAEREAQQTEQVILSQLEAVLNLPNGVELFRDAVIAYEPVWAIGTGKTASPEQAQAVHAFIRGKIAALDPEIAGKLPVIYGGSVKADNAKALFAMPDIDGGLVGGASLNAFEFLEILACINLY